MCSLERKSYTNEAKYANFECLKCGALNTVQVLPENTKLKSNVDVFMAGGYAEIVPLRRRSSYTLFWCRAMVDFAEAIQGLWISIRMFFVDRGGDANDSSK